MWRTRLGGYQGKSRSAECTADLVEYIGRYSIARKFYEIDERAQPAPL